MIKKCMSRVRSRIRKYNRHTWVKACIKRRRTGRKLFLGNRFCVIYRWAEHTGIYSHITTCLPALYWAEREGLIPVFDTRDVPNVHKSDDKEDWYELFFEPPAGFSIDDVANAENYIVVDAEALYDSTNVKADNEMQFLKKKDLLEELRSVYNKYIRINERTKAYIEFVWKQLTGNQESDGFLGVRCRGTGYNIVRPKGLSSVITVDIIALVKQAMKEGGMDKIFLATDDADIILLFKESFDDDMLFYIEEEDRISTADVEQEIE